MLDRVEIPIYMLGRVDTPYYWCYCGTSMKYWDFCFMFIISNTHSMKTSSGKCMEQKDSNSKLLRCNVRALPYTPRVLTLQTKSSHIMHSFIAMV